jgi:WD40 repeat protein
MTDDLRQNSVPAEFGSQDGRLADPAFLVNGDPGEVAALLDTASGPEARLAAAVYQVSADTHREARRVVRRQLLALDAARCGDRDLAARISAVPVEGEPEARWGVEWATGSQVNPRFGQPLPGHTEKVTGVALAVVHGRLCVVSGSYDDTVRVRDIATGQLVQDPLVPDGDCFGVEALATTVNDGRPVAISGNGNYHVYLWELDLDPEWLELGYRADRSVGEHGNGFPSAVATATLNGQPVAVTAGDGRVEVWHLSGREIAYAYMWPQGGGIVVIRALATAVLDGKAVVVAGAYDGTLRIWELPDLREGRRLRLPEVGVFRLPAQIGALTVAEVGGRTLILAGVGDSLRLIDPATGRHIGPLPAGHSGAMEAMATGVAHGRPVVVTGGQDGTVRVWPLDVGRQLPKNPIAVLAFPSAVSAVAMAEDGRLAVGFGHEVAVLAPC